MLCCELESTVNDLASGLRQSALEEVKQKKILGNAYTLTRCANPYGIKNMVISEKQSRTEIHYCGELVFLWNYELKRYICGEWTDILSNEVKVMRDQRRCIKAKDSMQVLVNNHALKNYVTC